MTGKAPESWIDVYTCVEESEAAIVAGVLETEGIPCRVESSRISTLPVSFGKLGEVTVYVHSADFEKAKKVLEAARALEGEDLP